MQELKNSLNQSLMDCNYKWDEDNLKAGIRKKTTRKCVFTDVFPTDQIKGVKFETSDQISIFLLRNSLQIGLVHWQVFQKTVMDKGTFNKIVYTCRQKRCYAKLVYHQKKFREQDELVNSSIRFYLSECQVQNKHSHMFKLTPKIAKEQGIRQYLFDLPVEEQFEHHIELVKKKFNLSNCQAKYIKQRIFWKFKDEDHMLKRLTEKKVMFRRKIEQGKTTILVIASEAMKQKYIQFGDTICFDITYKLLKKKRADDRHLGVGFFVGQDQDLRIVLFAMATIQHETTENFMQLFQFFFDIMGYLPETIITDDQKAIGSAFQKLKKERKYNYVHLLDWFHKMDGHKKLLRRQVYQGQIRTLMNRMLKESSKFVYLDMLAEIAQIIQNEEIMREFIKYQCKYSLAFVPDRFVGFAIISARAQSFNNLIKMSIPYQTNLGRLIYFVLRVQKRLANRMHTFITMSEDVVSSISNKQVLMLAQYLEHYPFEQVRQYYEQSRVLEILPINVSVLGFSCCSNNSPLLLHRQVSYQKYERHYSFKLCYSLKHQCWRCQCRNIFKTGMPCAHIVRVVRENGGTIGYYINERWLKDKKQAKIVKTGRPRPKIKRI